MRIRNDIALFTGLLVAGLAVATESSGAPPAPALAEELDYFALVCSHCHGMTGEGKREIGAPTLAGLPDWYVVAQMEKFRKGQRGLHPQDTEGALMRAIALSVNDEMEAGALRTIASLAPRPTVRDAAPDGKEPDLDTGEFLYYAAECAACHRYNGSGELAFASPPLTNLQDWYIERQLLKFAEGIRGYHPDDIGGVKMQPFARSVAGKNDLDDLLAFIVKLAEKYPPMRDIDANPPRDRGEPNGAGPSDELPDQAPPAPADKAPEPAEGAQSGE